MKTSPDGKNIVAIYYEDAMSVLHRSFHDGRHITLNPSVNGSIGNQLFGNLRSILAVIA